MTGRRRSSRRCSSSRSSRDVNSDQQNKGLETDLVIDRATAARLGITASQIDNTLYDAFGQRQVRPSTIALNQYHVVMEVAPQFWQSPDTLEGHLCQHLGRRGRRRAGDQRRRRDGRRAKRRPSGRRRSPPTRRATQRPTRSPHTGHSSASTGAAVSTSAETMVPLAAFSHFGPGNTPLAVNHQGLFVASTISFNLAPGKSLSDAIAAIDEAMNRHRRAGHHPRHLPGHGAGLPAIARQRALS